MAYEVVFYRTARGESPVERFVGSLPRSAQQKLAAMLILLAEEGPRLGRPYAAHVRGPLRELRVQFARHETRILHFLVRERQVVLLHAFAKKTQRLQERELATAEARMKDLMRRLGQREFPT
jgi:phage-related protein